MIRRTFRLAVAIVVCFCVATCIAETILVGYVWNSGKLNRDKLVQMVAVAHGIDLAQRREEPGPAPQPPPTEQVSLEEIARVRAIHVRQLELREQALKNAMDQIRFDQEKLADQRKRYKQQKEEFDSRLLAMEKDARSGGAADVAAIMEKIKAKQAKEQILKMLNDREIDAVVVLLAGMQDSKRAKIIGEFKTPDESEKLREVLRRIREGEPRASLAEKTQKQLNPAPTTGP
jgi:hypothetical protein